jgi:hypothetical protein
MKRSTGAVLMLACVAGCGGGSGSGMAPPSSATPPPTTTMSVDFTTFTKTLMANQSDTALPLAVTPTQFVFRDDDNPEAFASVLPGP